MKHMQKILSDAENIHRKMALELEEEKEKNAKAKGTSPDKHGYPLLCWSAILLKNFEPTQSANLSVIGRTGSNLRKSK